MLKKLSNKINKYLEEVMEMDTSPHSIAIGFALGTFIAILPTFGLGAFIGLFIVFLFKKINKASLLVSFVIWNPFILALLIPFEYSIGDYFLMGVPIRKYKFEILNQLFLYSRRFLLGNFILATVASFASYFLVLYLAQRYKKSKIILENLIQ